MGKLIICYGLAGGDAYPKEFLAVTRHAIYFPRIEVTCGAFFED